jgi:hypothetical protein
MAVYGHFFTDWKAGQSRSNTRTTLFFGDQNCRDDAVPSLMRRRIGNFENFCF